MSVTVDELILKLKWEAETGNIKLTEQEIQKLKTAFGQAATEEDKLEKKITSASLAFDRKARAVNNSRDAIIRAQSAFSGFGGTIGQVGNQVFNLTNQVEDLEFASKRAGTQINVFTDSLGNSVTALGKLGTASLVVSAAMAGWKLGSMINEIDGVSQAVEGLWAKLIKLDPVLRQIAQQNNALVTDEQIAQLKAVTDALNIALFQKYAITIDSAGKSVQQYNKEVLAALHGQKDFVNTTDQTVSVVAKMPPVMKAAASSVDLFAEALKKGGKSAEQMGIVLSSLTDSTTEWENAAKKMGLVAEGSFQGLLNNLDLLAPKVSVTAAAFTDLGDSLDGFDFSVDDTIEKLNSLAFAFAQIGSEIGGLTGGILNAVASGLQGIADAAANSTSKFQGFLNGAAAGLSQLGEWGKIASTALTGVSNIAAGIASMNIIQIIQGIVQVAIAAYQALKKLFSHNWAKDVQQNIHGLILPKELAQQIADLAKELGNAQAAILQSFSDIVDALGVTEGNFYQLTQLAHDLFSGIQTGAITAAQATEELNDTFARLAEVADKMGGAASARLAELIQLTRQFGLEVQAVTDYVNKQIGIIADSTNTLAQSLQAMMDKIPAGVSTGFSVAGPIGTPTGILPPPDFSKWGDDIDKIHDKWDSLVALVSAGIEQIILNGGSLTDVFAQFGGQLDVIEEAAKRFGFFMDGSLGDLIALGDLVSGKLAGLIGDVTALGNAMSALGHLGVAPSIQEFDKFGDSVDKVFKKLVKGGASAPLALAQIAPQLKIIAQLQEQFGLHVDKSTQKLIDQARAAGLLDPSPEEQMLDATLRMADSMEQLVAIFGGATAGANEFAASIGSIPTDVDVNVNTHYNSDTTGPTYPPPDNSGNWVWSKGRWIYIGDVHPLSGSTSPGSGGPPPPPTLQNASFTVQTTHYVMLDGKVIDKYVTTAVEEGRIRLDRQRKAG